MEQKEILEKFDLKLENNDKGENESYIIDKIFVKGVSHNRDLNDSNLDYNYVSHHENEGLRFYMHKYFIGFHAYYLKAKH